MNLILFASNSEFTTKQAHWLPKKNLKKFKTGIYTVMVETMTFFLIHFVRSNRFYLLQTNNLIQIH